MPQIIIIPDSDQMPSQVPVLNIQQSGTEELSEDLKHGTQTTAEKKSSCKSISLNLGMLIFACLSAAPFSINTFFGIIAVMELFTSFEAPGDISELTKHGIEKIPYPLLAVASLGAAASELVNVWQFFAFAHSMWKTVTEYHAPMIKKAFTRGTSLTKKEKHTLHSLLLCSGASTASSMVAWDSSEGLPMYFGIASTGATGLMTLLTRSVSSDAIINQIPTVYADPDKAFALEAFLALDQIYLALQKQQFSKDLLPTYHSDDHDLSSDTVVAAIKTIFDQYSHAIDQTDPEKRLKDIADDDIMIVIRKYLSDLSYVQAPLPWALGLFHDFVACSIASAGWLLYMLKLGNLFPHQSKHDTTATALNLILAGIVTYLTVAHSPIFYKSIKDAPDFFSKSFSISKLKTMLISIGVLMSSFGLFNVMRTLQKNQHEKGQHMLIPLPEYNSGLGLTLQLLTLVGVFAINLNSTIKMTTLKQSIADDNTLLGSSSFQQVLDCIKKEKPTQDELLTLNSDDFSSAISTLKRITDTARQSRRSCLSRFSSLFSKSIPTDGLGAPLMLEDVASENPDGTSPDRASRAQKRPHA